MAEGTAGKRSFETWCGPGGAGDAFDYSTFFLQVCLVMGAMSLILQDAKLGRAFFTAMLVLGIVGTGFAVIAFVQASGVG